jgi:hypothetical protein
MEDVQLDAKQRRFVWPDGKRLDLDQSVAHIQIQKQYPDFSRDWIEEYLIDWVLLCLHEWGAHEHPSLTSPQYAKPRQRPSLVLPGRQL